ncbi:MAG: M20/M25/M40 family metallo-hydrolase [Fimbriimonadaceae bacterium]|nr:M20/M25/M40 family metallo-hydrolase [Fimbriimonadaceae bacterium]
MFARLRLLLAVPVLAWAGTALAQQPPEDQVIDSLIKETRDNSHTVEILRELCGKFGPRVTASDALLAAQHWAVRKFTDFGVDKVWLEQYQEAPVRFQRNAAASWGGLTAPYRYKMAFSTPAYTVGTKGPVAGPPVKMPATMDEAKNAAAQLKGAWVLMPRMVGMGSANLSRPTDLDKFVDSCGIAGRVYSTNADSYVWTHGSWVAYNKQTRPKTPLVTISKNDYGLVEYNMAKGRAPILEFNIDQKLEDRPTPLYNVVAEIKGSVRPSEYVIISGHFDSWDGPGSQGAMDNGTGSSMVLELARTFAKLKLRPMRTVRFVLWSGEEQGLLGSRGYTEKHKDELANIQAVFVEDHGQNPYQAIVVQEDMKPFFESVVAKLAGAYPEFPFTLQTTQRLPAGGSDHGSFIARGVPGFQLQKAPGPVSYTEIWHTQNDQVRYVQSRCVAQNATYVGVLAYHLANIPERLPKAQAGNNRRAGGG